MRITEDTEEPSDDPFGDPFPEAETAEDGFARDESNVDADL